MQIVFASVVQIILLVSRIGTLFSLSHFAQLTTGFKHLNNLQYSGGPIKGLEY